MTDRTLTGRHVLAMFAGGFGIIIAVNVTLAVNAVRTFPGLEVPNSYIASQSFDTRRAAQEALGWQARAGYADGEVRLTVLDKQGNTLDPAQFEAVIGRPTTVTDDRTLSFDRSGRSDVTLAPGNWRLDLRSRDGAAPFAQTLSLRVAP